jgi:hypothetical protein
MRVVLIVAVMLQFLSILSSILVLVGLVWAPWAYGSIPTWAWTTLCAISYLAFGFYLITSIFKKSFPLPPWPVLFVLAWILGQGWWMYYNARYVLWPGGYQLIPLDQKFPNWPGSYDRDATFVFMLQISSFIGAAWVAGIMGTNLKWRKRLLDAMGITAITLLLFGVIQKILGTSGIWPQYGRNVWPFATYFYHGNAGAFINLTFPIVVALTWRSAFIDSKPIWRAVWVCALIIQIAAAMVNTSKAALFIFGWLILALLILSGWYVRRMKLNMRTFSTVIVGGSLILFAIGVVALSSGTGAAVQRWIYAFNERETILEGRVEVAKILTESTPMSGTWGFGPGSFTSMFPYLAVQDKTPPEGRWIYAHEDYLQTLIEWGYTGAVAWAILVLGGIFYGLYILQKRKNHLRKRDSFLLCCLIIALAGVCIHSLVDFPLQIPSLQYYTAIILGMIWFSKHWERPQLRGQQKSSRINVKISRSNLPPKSDSQNH